MIKLFLILFFTVYAFADESVSKEFYKIPYETTQEDSLLDILKMLKKSSSVITKKNKAYKRTIKENPTILDWDHLVPYTQFHLFIKIKDLDMDKYARYISNDEIIENSDKVVDQKAARPSGLKGSIFYMASYGKFTQVHNDTNITFYQNSPISLGTAWSFYPENSLWSFASSVYSSYLLATGSNLGGKKVDVPLELGGNFYPEYRFNKLNFTGYFGIDYERFSTFDVGALEDEQLKMLKTSVLYATLGASKLIEIFPSPIFTKLSFSRSIASSSEKDTASAGNYQGYKVMWYLNKKISKEWFIHSLLKYHWMDGPSKLTTTRIGLGFGYIFN